MRTWLWVVAAAAVEGCTIVAVTKGASADGSSLTAHTDDAGWTAADVRLVHVPAKDHAPGSTRAVYDFNAGYPRLVTNDRGSHYAPREGQELTKPLGFIPQVAHTYAYFDQDYGMMNEVQLSIAESTCSAKTVGWPSTHPYGYNLFGIAELSKIALERCDSARCAIRTMGDLAVEHGFFSEDSGDPAAPGYGDSAETLAISDKYGETWIFHVLTGPHNASAVWAAQRVPDGHVTAVANFFTIRTLNLSDPDNYLASPNVESFAVEMGWWHPSDGPIDFTRAYAYAVPGPVLALYAGRRVWRIFDTFAPSLRLDSTLGSRVDYPTYPFSVAPDAPIEIDGVMELLKDHYEGTPYDMTKGVAAGPFGAPVRFDGPHVLKGGWERAISMYRTMFSFVLQVRGAAFDDAVGGTLWYGQGSPHGTVYVPFSCAQTSVPASYLTGKESEFSTDSMWWAFAFVNNWSLLRFSVINADVRAEARRWQAEAFEGQRGVANRSLRALESHNNAFATKLFHGWWALAWRLVGKYSDGYVTTDEGPDGMQVNGYPLEWLKTTEYVAWPGNTYKNPPADDATVFAASPSAGVGLVGVLLGMFIGIGVMLALPKRRREYHRLA
ncbi:peptidase [Achlya hypogyna]|uniref:Peptidase n=1 Tax=Achlya hypogyna TaxID=1202772 RepID=A0A1V9ZE89_ACHHY|nr:peptidase [Achlya hypogyna]